MTLFILEIPEAIRTTTKHSEIALVEKLGRPSDSDWTTKSAAEEGARRDGCERAAGMNEVQAHVAARGSRNFSTVTALKGQDPVPEETCAGRTRND